MYGAWDLSILAMMYHLEDYAGGCWPRVGTCLGAGIGLGEAVVGCLYNRTKDPVLSSRVRPPIADRRSKHTIRWSFGSKTHKSSHEWLLCTISWISNPDSGY